MPEVAISKTPAPKLTRLHFLERFTLEEMVQIEQASRSDAEVGAIIRLLDFADVVDLQNDKLQMGMNLLVSKGLITEERRKEIMGE